MPKRILARLTGRRPAAPLLRPVSPAAAARLATASTSPRPASTPAAGPVVPGVPGPGSVYPTGPRPAATSGAGTKQPLEPSHVLDAVVAPGRIALVPGRYVVVYDRVGPHGRRGTPKPKPISADVCGVVELADAIREDIQHYIAQPGLLEVFIDLQVSGGSIHVGGRPVGTFDFSCVEAIHQDGAPAA